MKKLLAALAMVVLAACGGGDDDGGALDEPEETEAAAVTGTVDAADQTSDGKSMTVKFVTIDGSAGFIAVHKDLNGQPGPVVGHAAVSEGATENVLVTFDTEQTTGAVWPMLHVDAGQVGTYEFPGADVPVTAAGAPVMKKITLTVG